MTDASVLDKTAPAPEFGPAYPELPRAKKWRNLSRKRTLTPDERCAYASAITADILALQRREGERTVYISSRCPCASGTWLLNGPSIETAIRRQHRAALERAAETDRKRRTDDQICVAYAAAMAETRAAAAAETSAMQQPAEPIEIRVSGTAQRDRSAAAHKAWATIRARAGADFATIRRQAALKAWATRRGQSALADQH